MLELGDRVGPTVEKFKFKYFELPSDRMLLPYNHRGGEAIRAACKHVLGPVSGQVQQLGGDSPVQLQARFSVTGLVVISRSIFSF